MIEIILNNMYIVLLAANIEIFICIVCRSTFVIIGQSNGIAYIANVRSIK